MSSVDKHFYLYLMVVEKEKSLYFLQIEIDLFENQV